MSPVRRSDAVLVALALGLGLVHLGYPLGREHAALAYAGREWLTAGTSPYNGTFIQEGPGLVLVAGVASVLGGGSGIVLRLLSVVAAVATGVLAAHAVGDERSRARAPAAGLAALGASVFAHVFFGAWDAARGGTFFSLAIVGALALGHTRPRSSSAAAFGAGALAAFALSLRPAGFPVVAFVAIVVLTKGASARRCLAFVAGAAAVTFAFALALGPHAIADGYDLLWDARCLYLGPSRHDRGALFFTLHDAVGAYEPHATSALVLFGLGVGLAFARGDRARLGSLASTIGVGVTSLVSVLLVRRYFFDFEVMTAFVALVLASISDAAVTTLQGRAHRAVVMVALQICLLLGAWGFVQGLTPSAYPARVHDALQRLAGRTNDTTWLATFDRPEIGFYVEENLAVARFVRDRTSADDGVLVRGYEPEIYLAAGRSLRKGRFFVTPPLVWPGCAYRRREWLTEDQRVIADARPKVVVAIVATPGPDAEGTFTPLGYEPVLRTAHYVVLERR